MSGTTLADRMVAAADRFPTIDALVLFQPSRRDAHAAELAAKIPQTNPPFDVAATAAALADRLPPGCPQPEDFRNPRFGCLTTKVLLPLDPDHPAQCVSRIQLYDGIEWMIHVYGWPTAAGHAATARRLFHLLCGDAASSFLGGRAKGDTPLQSWLIDLAESDPHKLIVD